jgi:hypothetical protein
MQNDWDWTFKGLGKVAASAAALYAVWVAFVFAVF